MSFMRFQTSAPGSPRDDRGAGDPRQAVVRCRPRPGDPSIFLGLAGHRLGWVLSAALAAACAACGGTSDLSATLAPPSEGPPRITVTPALDLSGLGEAVLEERGWSERLVIEHIALSVEDVRLLGADPRIPAGGLALLDEPQVLAADGRPEVSLSLPFPRQFVGSEDLAVFVRIAPAAALEGASVEVYARLYTSAPAPGGAQLSAAGSDVDPVQDAPRSPPPSSTSGAVEESRDAVDPDVDPARPQEAQDPAGAVDPDVDPAHPREHASGEPVDSDGAVDPDVDPARDPEGGVSGAVDPDVDPARPKETSSEEDASELARSARAVSGESTSSRSSALKARGLPPHLEGAQVGGRAEDGTDSIAFVLRDEQAADMVASLVGNRLRHDVVVGIPAARWFTPRVMASLERGLPDTLEESAPGRGPAATYDALGLLEVRRGPRDLPVETGALGRSTPGDPSNTTFFLTNERIEGNSLRRGDH